MKKLSMPQIVEHILINHPVQALWWKGTFCFYFDYFYHLYYHNTSEEKKIKVLKYHNIRLT